MKIFFFLLANDNLYHQNNSDISDKVVHYPSTFTRINSIASSRISECHIDP